MTTYVNPCVSPYPDRMDTQNTRLTRAQAAELAGVTMRTINRWSAEGILTVHYGGWRDPATYDRAEVLRAAGMVDVLLPDLD